MREDYHPVQLLTRKLVSIFLITTVLTILCVLITYLLNYSINSAIKVSEYEVRLAQIEYDILHNKIDCLNDEISRLTLNHHSQMDEKLHDLNSLHSFKMQEQSTDYLIMGVTILGVLGLWDTVNILFGWYFGR